MSERWRQFDLMRGVYVTGFADYAKIGWSVRIGKRLREIECGTPETLALYLVFPDADRSWEKTLHHRFAEHRTRNEWFKLAGSLREYVKLRSMEPFDDSEPPAMGTAGAMTAVGGMRAVAFRPRSLAARRTPLELVK